MDDKVKKILNVAVVVALVLWLLFGVFHVGGGNVLNGGMKVPTVN